MSILEQTELLTLAAWIERYDEQPFEYIHGAYLPMSPNKSRHGTIAKQLLFALDSFTLPKALGESFMEMPFVLTDQPDWVRGSRVPDVMFFRAERLAAWKASDPDWGDKPFVLVPDLTIEIISPNDRYSDISNKISLYLQDGVQAVWIVDPKQRSVTVYLAADKWHLLAEKDTLDGGELIPGFALPLAKIFD